MKFVPNLITILRILIIPWIPYVFLNLNINRLAMALVIFAALSDFLDGYLARRLGAISLVGQVLDPLADKLFLLTIVYTLFASDFLPSNFVLMFLAIEAVFIFVGLYLWFFNRELLVKAGPTGKIATALFFLLSVLSFTRLSSSYLIPGFYLVLAFKLLSIYCYGNQIIRGMKEQNKAKEN